MTTINRPNDIGNYAVSVIEERRMLNPSYEFHFSQQHDGTIIHFRNNDYIYVDESDSFERIDEIPIGVLEIKANIEDIL